MPATKRKAAPPPSPERRTPAQGRSLQRVAAVLAAAREALAEVGYGRMTMLDIAARAGVTHTSIYHYFKSVEEILAALMQEVLDQFNAEGYRLVEKATTATELVEASIVSWRLAFEMYREAPDAQSLYAAARNVPQVSEIEQADYRKWVKFIVGHFGRVLSDVDVRPLASDITILVSTTIAMYDLILQQPKSQRDHMQAQIEEMLRFRLEKSLLRCAPGLAGFQPRTLGTR